MTSDAREEWRSWLLYDVAEYINGRPTKPSELEADGVPVIKIAELTRGITDTTNRIPTGVVQDKHWVKNGDLLFAWSGTVGIHIYRGPRAALNQHIFRVVAKPGVDQRFLRYLLEMQMPTFRAFVENKKTTMGHVTVRDLKTTSVSVPPLPQQVAIAEIVGALDGKIDLNWRMNGTLEALSRTVFDTLIVVGRARHSIVDETPPADAWERVPLDRVANFLNGAACQRYPANDEDVSLPVVKIRELNQGLTAQSDRVTAAIPEKWHVHDGDVLFSWSGTLLAKVWTGGEAALNQHLFKVTSTDYPKWFYFRWVVHHLDTFRGVAADKATTMGHIKRHHLSDAQCCIPPVGILKRLDALMAPLLERQVACELESRTLAEVRDTLLLKLISGEIRIPDAERVVSEVT